MAELAQQGSGHSSGSGYTRRCCHMPTTSESLAREGGLSPRPPPLHIAHTSLLKAPRKQCSLLLCALPCPCPTDILDLNIQLMTGVLNRMFWFHTQSIPSRYLWHAYIKKKRLHGCALKHKVRNVIYVACYANWAYLNPSQRLLERKCWMSLQFLYLHFHAEPFHYCPNLSNSSQEQSQRGLFRRDIAVHHESLLLG